MLAHHRRNRAGQNCAGVRPGGDGPAARFHGAGVLPAHSKHIPLFPWIDLLAGWLGLDENAAPAEQARRLSTELACADMSASENALADMLACPGLNA